MQGIVVSNHGGRQLDTARSGIEILPEVMAALKSVGAEGKLEVYVDGGIRRGSDIFKALALGAKVITLAQHSTRRSIDRYATHALPTHGTTNAPSAYIHMHIRINHRTHCVFIFLRAGCGHWSADAVCSGGLWPGGCGTSHRAAA